jgi:3-phenylpropionate/trans-cinnamate dioxygenase ferredoxin reductase subunit
MTQPSSVLVVGAGQAAGVLARTLREQGFAGAITLVGDEALPPYERPPLSKGVLLGQQMPEDALLQPVEWYGENGVALLLDRTVTGVDAAARRVMLADGTWLEADALVFATGARARPLAVAGAGLPGVCLMRSMADALGIRTRLETARRVVVVGAGLLGLEAAAAARARGAAVTLVEAGPRALERVLPAPVGEHVAALHRSRGVEIRFGTTVTAFRGGDVLQRVALSDGSMHDADLAIVAIGALPNDELARAAGLEVADGIRVDASCRASVEGIYAIGDVARHPNPVLDRHWRLESWQNAQNQAAVCARVIAGEPAEHAEVPWFWTEQYDKSIQFAGCTSGAVEPVLRGDPAEGPFSVLCLEGERLVGVVGVDRPRDVREARAMIARRERVRAGSLADATRPLRQAVLA